MNEYPIAPDEHRELGLKKTTGEVEIID